MPVARKPATTVIKVCRIIREFQYRKSFGITDLAHRTDLLPSDVHRILSALSSGGYVEQDPETKLYRLGLGFMRLSAFQHNELCKQARPLLSRLSEQLEASVYLGLYDEREHELFVIEQIESASTGNPFRDHIGGAEGLHCTALGKVILAGLDHATMTGAIEKTGMKRYTVRTITDMNTLERQLEQIRKLGYSVDRGEYIDGACCLATPVRDYSGHIVGAISTSMTSRQFQGWDEGALATRIKTAATAVSSAIPYR